MLSRGQECAAPHDASGEVTAEERTSTGLLNGNRTHTAEALGLSRQGLLKKLERYGLT